MDELAGAGDRKDILEAQRRGQHARLDADTDGMACAGMPSLPADLEAVRSKRKAFRALIDQDLARVTQLLKACDDLAALIRTTGWLHHETPLEAAPSV